MKTLILVGSCAVFLVGGAQAYAERHDRSTELSVDHTAPETIACSQERGAALGQCTYRIKRDKAGKTTVTVVFANGFNRGLIFEDGQFLKASVTMSGVGTDADWNLKDGMHVIQVDGQRYEVPDVLISDK